MSNELKPGEKKEEKKEPTFEELIQQLDSEEKKDAARAQLRLRKAEYEERIRQLEARAGGGKVTEPSNVGEKPERWDVVGGKPVKDPDGEYENYAQAYKAADLQLRTAALEAAKANDPSTYLKFLKEQGFVDTGKKDEFMSKFMSELASRSVENLVRPASAGTGGEGAMKALQAEMSSLREEVRKSSDPIESAKRVKDLFETLRAVGLIPEPSPAGGEPIEHLKEKHRHEEKIRELNIDGKYKDNLTDTLSEIPERVGRGLASQVSEEEGGGSSTESGGGESGFKSFHCECGHDIRVPPEAGPTITCGKCGAIYSREKSAPGPEAKT